MSKVIRFFIYLLVCFQFIGAASAADERFSVDINVDVTDVNASTD